MINQFNLSTCQFFPLNVPSLNQPKATTKGLYSLGEQREAGVGLYTTRWKYIVQTT